MDVTDLYFDSTECKQIGGYCNFSNFQTWYCEWKEMDLLEDLCPLPAFCCISKMSGWIYYIRTFIPITIFYYTFSILALMSAAFFIAKLAKSIFVFDQSKRSKKMSISTSSEHKFPTTPAIEEWAIKTMIKLFPAVLKNELKVGVKISEGAFLNLHKSAWRVSSVCLKSMKCQNENIDIFLNEAAILWRIRMSSQKFKSMPLHICHFNGICQLKPTQFGIVLEWMNLGSVHSFLNDQKTSTNIVRELQNKDLLRIAVQACAGLYQLQTLLIMHGNICARNCLLSGDPFKPDKLIAKLSDFGNSQMLLTKNDIYEYWVTERKSWPYKWMAPECFLIGAEETYQFSLHSDIWSFGVFLLELFSMGAEPYQNMEQFEAKSLLLVDPKMNAMNFNEFLIPHDVKRAIRKCFAVAPKERPKSEQLLKMLQQCQH